MDAMQQAKDLFGEFMAFHPNATEEFVPTLDNIRRWQWGVDSAKKRADVETQPFAKPDGRSAKALATSRAVGIFSRLSTMTKEKFMTLASFFPGRDVYAIGSRITGEYIDHDSPEKIKTMRATLLKKETQSSDYDITLDFQKNDNIRTLKKGLPSWADLVLKVPPDDPKIKIPMWDFSKLPVERHAEVVEMVEKKQWGALMDIHNQYKLTDTFFCCDEKPAQRWFTHAVKEGIIQRPVESAPPVKRKMAKKKTVDEKP